MGRVASQASSGASCSYVISRADGGRSVGDFAEGNLADHVGDDEGAVATNRRMLASALKAQKGLAFIAASHGADVAWVTTPDTFADVDALVTDRHDIGLVALGADCAVIGLHGHRSDGTPVLGVAHCGWKGLGKDVIGSIVVEMTSAGAEDISAVLGPGDLRRVLPSRHRAARRGSSGGERAGSLYAALVSLSQQPAHVQQASHEQKDEGFGIDIRAGSRERLLELGVAINGEELLQGRECTYESATWFSYRRSMANGRGGRSGRQGLAVISPTQHGVGRIVTVTRREVLAQRLHDVHERIEAARIAASRTEDDDQVQLVVVTKTFPASDISLLAELGVTDVGENRDQEGRAKRSGGAQRRTPLAHDRSFTAQQGVVRLPDGADIVESIDRHELIAPLAGAVERFDRETGAGAAAGELGSDA